MNALPHESIVNFHFSIQKLSLATNTKPRVYQEDIHFQPFESIVLCFVEVHKTQIDVDE